MDGLGLAQLRLQFFDGVWIVTRNPALADAGCFAFVVAGLVLHGKCFAVGVMDPVAVVAVAALTMVPDQDGLTERDRLGHLAGLGVNGVGLVPCGIGSVFIAGAAGGLLGFVGVHGAISSRLLRPAWTTGQRVVLLKIRNSAIGHRF